ncbi:MAG: Asp23/Gls24 family envelope stress response protein, partial [Candidatus Omnitrophica bacterium]|nr:Asp23/Gls24 family envelope stress response protein [Candidatus Omnitrophota bacterium]
EAPTLMVDGIGSIEVSDEVIRSIINVCSSEVPGIAGVSEETFMNGAFKMLRSTEFPKGIRITDDEETSGKKVDVSVQIEFGVAIPAVACEFQKKVKNQVERIAGISVSEVNIHVDGVQASVETPTGPRVVTPPETFGAGQSAEDEDEAEIASETQD